MLPGTRTSSAGSAAIPLKPGIIAHSFSILPIKLGNRHVPVDGCSIYALVDPRAPDIWRYVGRSFQPAPRRAQHVADTRKPIGYRTVKEAWIARLLAEGVEPILILLEPGIPSRQAEAREDAWIERGFALGHPLTNSVRPYRRNANARGKEVLTAMRWLRRGAEAMS